MENPHLTDLVRQGLFLRDRGRLREALAMFARATELDPDDKFAWTSMGELLLKLGNEREAVAALATADFIAQKVRDAHLKY